MTFFRISFWEIVGLFSILCFAVFIYTVQLASIPAGLYVDEALSGYNAFSLLTTGHDEYGAAFPVAMRFFGSYSPPLYTYLTIPMVAFIGLTVEATRLVSVISGLTAVVAVFLFIKSFSLVTNRLTPLIGALCFATLPWTVFYARAGYEIMLAFVLFVWGLVFIWWGTRYPKLLLAGIPILSLSVYASHTQQYLAPLLFITIGLLLRKQLLQKSHRRFLILGLAVSLFIQLPNAWFATTPAFWNKAGLFYAQAIDSQAEKISHFLPYQAGIVLATAREFAAQWFAYFSPKSLFFLPDPDPQRSLPGLSVFYFWQVIPYLIGMAILVKNIKSSEMKFLSVLLLLTPIPAAFSGHPFSTQRALPLLLPVIMIISLGIDRLINYRKKLLVRASLVMALSFSLILLWRSYFVLFPHERATVWGYGFSQLSEIIKHQQDWQFVIDQSRLKPAYIELAFFTAYPAQLLQQAVDPSIKDNYYTNTVFSSYYRFANIETRPIEWESDIYKPQILVGDQLSISEVQAREHLLTRVFEIRDPLGQIVFVGYQTNPSGKCQDTQFASRYCQILNPPST